MKKVRLTVLAVVLAGTLLVGCSSQPAADPGQRSGDSDAGAVIGYEPSGEELTWVESHTGEAGVFVKTFGDHRLVLVTMGEKSTAGYEVVIDEATTSGDTWVVNVVYDEPESGDMVAQVLTYPYDVVKISNDGQGVQVFDITGDDAVELEVTVE